MTVGAALNRVIREALADGDLGQIDLDHRQDVPRVLLVRVARVFFFFATSTPWCSPR